ncbi:MAG TPA: isocitrate dehydrogenase (NADP(+)) [Candidatus Sumerlaeota bacterium]|nr:isocitrate dehydrogenase (NADP(+)) [Candidatus Sumerlaeota bacterium]
MPEFKHITVPAGDRITFCAGRPVVGDHPIVGRITGDGIGPDIMRASVRVWDAAVEKAYGGKKKIAWCEIPVGEIAQEKCGTYMPDEAFDAIRYLGIAIKGPLTTPVGGGFRSLNVTLRQVLDLYACVRPVRWFKGVPSPVKAPEKLNVIIFRENTEDVYSGIEYRSGTPDAQKVIEFLTGRELGAKIRPDSGVGIKPMSPYCSKRIVRMALRHALEHGLPTVTMMHKGNIMKFTEGAFRDWGYEVAREEFPDTVVTENDLYEKYNGQCPAGKVVLKDRIADSIFQQLLLRPDEYSVLVTPNLNGDYVSDACAAQVGGLGIAPGANLSDDVALFEATHGTAPKYAGLDVVNPGSLILSGVMMLEHMGWKEAADSITRAIEATIQQKTVTYDLERLMEGATKVKTSEFAECIVKNL